MEIGIKSLISGYLPTQEAIITQGMTWLQVAMAVLSALVQAMIAGSWLHCKLDEEHWIVGLCLWPRLWLGQLCSCASTVQRQQCSLWLGSLLFVFI